MRWGFLISRPPESEISDGLASRRTHRGVRQSLRPNQSCVDLEFRRLGASGPGVRHFCKIYMKSAVLPAPDGPKVEVEVAPLIPKRRIAVFRIYRARCWGGDMA